MQAMDWVIPMPPQIQGSKWLKTTITVPVTTTVILAATSIAMGLRDAYAAKTKRLGVDAHF
jgi:hypothetical protein